MNLGNHFGELMNNGKNVHSIEGIPKDKPASLDGRYGLVDSPFQGIHPRISRDPGWFEGYFNSIGVGEKAMCHLPVRSSSATASSPSVLAPRLILTRCHSLRRRVLCRSSACFTGPSPAWIPPARRRSWTSTKARLWEVIFLSCFKIFAAASTSASAGLSSGNLWVRL
jgi:hypothetical protein